jgi:hypothetical protein
VYPALHKQAKKSVEACGEIELTGQFSQVYGPVSYLNLPAAQDSHVSPLFPVYPALHLHCVMDHDCSGDDAYVGHDTHGPSPNSSLYVLALHVSQVISTVEVYCA